MNLRTIALSCAVTALSCAASGAASAAPEAKGVWMNDTGRGAIEIKDCGSKLCGHVVWTRDESDASRGCGKQIIGDAQSVGNGLWDNGWIYSPDKKRRYDVELKPLADGTLRVKGYAGTKLFSKTMIWTAAASDLKRCDAANVEAKATPPASTETAAISKASPTQPALAPAPVVAAKPLPPAMSATQALAAAEAAKASEPARPSITPPVVAKLDEKAESKPAAKTEQKSEPRIAEADTDDAGSSDKGDLLEKLEGMEFGNGYGVKKLDGGDCRVKLPYVTITVPCKK